MSVNIQESEAASGKRSHEEFAEASLRLAGDASPTFDENLSKNKFISASDLHQTSAIPISSLPRNSPPPGSSSPAALTEAGSSPTGQNTPSPNRTPSKSPLPPTSSAVSNPTLTLATSTQSLNPTAMSTAAAAQTTATAKRKRRTAAEIAADEQERSEKRRRREEEAAAKAEERAKQDAEKEAQRLARATVKAEKDAQKAEKDAQKAKADAEKAAKKEKEAKQAKIMFAFVGKSKQLGEAPSTPVKQIASNASLHSNPDVQASPVDVKKDSEQEVSAYNKLFKPFYVKPDVTVASQFSLMDVETRQAKSDILDQHVRAERGEVKVTPFDFFETFQMFGLPTRRGVLNTPVKKIMAEIYGDPLDNARGVPPIRTESQTARFTSVQDQLNAIPMKVLSFYEDVRPPYVGTVTSNMTHNLHKLSRKPAARVLELNYDYDSEAEWEEEEGEDLDDCDEEDEDNDGDEEMADFLDDADAEANAVAARPGFLRESSPKSTGICFEDRSGLGPSARFHKYRLHFLLESLEHYNMIDPFSTEYWQSKTAASKAVTSAPAQVSVAPSAPMGPPPVPIDAFGKLAASASGSSPVIDEKDLVPKRILDDFKKAIISDDINFLTKVAMIDMLAKRFPTATRAQVKTTLEKIAERVSVPGGKKSAKRWALLPGFGV